MRRFLVVVTAVAASCAPPPPSPVAARSTIAPPPAAARDRAIDPAIPASPPPPDVAAILAEIAPARMKRDVERLAAFGTRHTLSDATSPTRGIGAARAWIRDELARAAAASGRTGDEAMQVALDPHVVPPDGKRVPRATEVVNVVAVLPGASTDARARRYYVVGHYDSRATDVMDATSDAPGANDDASGVAVVLELARVMSRRRFDATIVLLATAGEEQGLLGAKAHADAARAAGIDVRAVLNDDIVGDPSPIAPADAERDRRAVRLFSEGIPADATADRIEAIRRSSAESDGGSRELARFVADVAAWEALPVRPWLVFRPDRFLRGGDHLPFAALGWPAVRFTTVDEHYDRQHQDVTVVGGAPYGDVPAFVDAAYLADVARVNGAALAHLTRAPSPPGDARVLGAALENGATLAWSPSPERDVAGYEIVWRATTAPTWEHARDVGVATRAHVEVPKDDFFLGVRAYDREGYRSPVAFARVAKD